MLGSPALARSAVAVDVPSDGGHISGRDAFLHATIPRLPLDNLTMAGNLSCIMKRLPILLLALALPLAARAEALPSRDPQVVVPLLRAWHEHGSFAHLEHILGRPDTETISGFSLTEFRLSDGTSIYVHATPNRNRVYTISRRAPGGLAHMLYDPLDGDLDHPQPASAPF
jgi:hypothetical protein